MKPTRWLLALSLLVLGCSGHGADEATGARGAGIVGGNLDSGDPSVVALWVGDGECTGTLISPRVVLTAQHCVVNLGPQDIQVYFGNDANSGTNWLNAVDVQAHPTGDIAAITMAQPGPAPVIPLSTHAFVQGDQGTPTRLVGFGVTSETGQDSGVKRQVMTTVTEWDSEFVYLNGVGKDSCYGDSGGPAFITYGGTEYVAGVVSFGTGACGTESSGNTRVDVFHDWITGYVAAHDTTTEPSCSADGQCALGCPAVDPDCPCAQDGFCGALCPDMASDPDCAGCGPDGSCRQDCPAQDPDCATPPGSGGGPGNSDPVPNATGGSGGSGGGSAGHPTRPHHASPDPQSSQSCSTSSRHGDSSNASLALVALALAFARRLDSWSKRGSRARSRAGLPP